MDNGVLMPGRLAQGRSPIIGSEHGAARKGRCLGDRAPSVGEVHRTLKLGKRRAEGAWRYQADGGGLRCKGAHAVTAKLPGCLSRADDSVASNGVVLQVRTSDKRHGREGDQRCEVTV